MFCSEKVGQTFLGVHITAKRAASLKMLFKRLNEFFQGWAVRLPAMCKGARRWKWHPNLRRFCATLFITDFAEEEQGNRAGTGVGADGCSDVENFHFIFQSGDIFFDKIFHGYCVVKARSV